MKKIYIIPTTKVVNVELQHIIAASLTGVDEEGGTANLTEESADEGADGMSRRWGSLWNDDEE